MGGRLVECLFPVFESRRTQRADARRHWADRTDELLQRLGEQLVQPALTDLEDGKFAIELTIVPGRLAGLPLHAAPLKDGRRLVERVGSLVYAPNVRVLSAEQDTSRPPTNILCVLSDPKSDLSMAAAECASVANMFRRAGAEVRVLALVGRAVGAQAFEQRGVKLDDSITLFDIAPRPDQVVSQLPWCDHFFYSGHGMRTAGQSGLVLINENGDETLLAEEDVLATPALRRHPLIVLSACETASGSMASAELFDLTSSFLRIGASFVIGGLWVVVEDCARIFTSEFYAALAHSSTPGSAFGVALQAVKMHRRRVPRSNDASSVPPEHPIYWAPFIAMRGE